jgi:hypothetical protein
MKYILALLLSTVMTPLWSQSEEYKPNQYDSEIQQIIRNVEGEQQEILVENLVKAETELEAEVGEYFTRYWTAMANNDQAGVYAMMSRAYQDVVSLSSHLKRKRLAVKKGQINSIEIAGEDCALAIGYIWGSSSSLGDNLRIPIKVFLFKEEGDWRVFKNPYENAMGLTLPGAKKFKQPCFE